MNNSSPWLLVPAILLSIVAPALAGIPRRRGLRILAWDLRANYTAAAWWCIAGIALAALGLLAEHVLAIFGLAVDGYVLATTAVATVGLVATLLRHMHTNGTRRPEAEFEQIVSFDGKAALKADVDALPDEVRERLRKLRTDAAGRTVRVSWFNKRYLALPDDQAELDRILRRYLEEVDTVKRAPAEQAPSPDPAPKENCDPGARPGETVLTRFSASTTRRDLGGDGRYVRLDDDGLGARVICGDPTSPNVWFADARWTDEGRAADVHLFRSEDPSNIVGQGDVPAPAVLVVLSCLRQGDCLGARAIVEAGREWRSLSRPGPRAATASAITRALITVSRSTPDIEHMQAWDVIARCRRRIGTGKAPKPDRLLLANMRLEDVEGPLKRFAGHTPEPVLDMPATTTELLRALDRLDSAPEAELPDVIEHAERVLSARVDRIRKVVPGFDATIDPDEQAAQAQWDAAWNAGVTSDAFCALTLFRALGEARQR